MHMSECCEVSNTNRSAEHCPGCKSRGKSVGLLTLKSLLVPYALEQLETSLSYFFCGTSECTVIYFNERNVFRQDDIKVPCRCAVIMSPCNCSEIMSLWDRRH
ncbi:hypothetical protein [Ferviditalea candida]|uniref:hypothetical protein n=1 Tax=Ferviditalea candida TaxID=3108399 RepID=UPI00352DF701